MYHVKFTEDTYLTGAKILPEFLSEYNKVKITAGTIKIASLVRTDGNGWFNIHLVEPIKGEKNWFVKDSVKIIRNESFRFSDDGATCSENE